MAWTRPTLTQLKERIETDITSRLTGGAPLLRFSVLKILATAFAGLVHILHGYLANLSRNLLPTTAESEWLDQHASSWGLARIAATFATGTLNLTGTNGNTIPIGTVYVSGLGIEYETTTAGTISGGTAAVSIRARAEGEAGNLPTSSVLSAQTPVAGVNDDGTTGAITGGVEREGDETLRERIIARISNPPAGGSAADYVAWARSVAGVGQAWCFPNHYGLGTVAVVIATTDPDDLEPDAGLITDVQTYIDSVRPVTATVTVAGIEPIVVDIDVSVTPYNSSIEDLIKANIEEMIRSEAEPGGTLYLSQIQRAIMNAGVQDYLIEEIKVDGVTEANANFDFTGFQLMIPGTFNVFELT